MRKPLLAIVTGRPGAGKSTLAARLAESLRCPLIGRDRLKEGLLYGLESSQVDHEEAARQVYELFFTSIEQHVRAGVSVVAEAAFQHPRWSAKLEDLLPLAHVRILVCEVPVDIAEVRMQARERNDPRWALFHPPLRPVDGPISYDPPKLPIPTLVLDTAKGIDPLWPMVTDFLSLE